MVWSGVEENGDMVLMSSYATTLVTILGVYMFLSFF